MERDRFMQRMYKKLPEKAAAVALAASVVVFSAGAWKHTTDERQRDSELQAQIDSLSADLAANAARQQKRADRLARITGAVAGADLAAANGDSLKALSDLPTSGTTVSAEQRAKLEAATYKIFSRPKGTSGSEAWSPSCTGVKVTVDDSPYLATAAHCFEEELKMTPLKGGLTGDTTALNFSQVSSREFGIVLPGSKPNRLNTPLILGEMSVAITGGDWAFLKPARRGEDRDWETTFNAIPGITYKYRAAPMLGEEVALYGLPAANDDSPVSATGRYLGRVTRPTDSDMSLDLVAIEPKSAGEDACNYGTSGSWAVSGGNYYFGPLSYRSNLSTDTKNEANPAGNIQWRLAFEKQLGMELLDVPTICGYTVEKDGTMQGLRDGFNAIIDSRYVAGQMK